MWSAGRPPRRSAVEVLASQKACRAAQLFHERWHLDIAPRLVVDAHLVVGVACRIQPCHLPVVEPLVRHRTPVRTCEDPPQHAGDGSKPVARCAIGCGHRFIERRRRIVARLRVHRMICEWESANERQACRHSRWLRLISSSPARCACAGRRWGERAASGCSAHGFSVRRSFFPHRIRHRCQRSRRPHPNPALSGNITLGHPLVRVQPDQRKWILTARASYVF